MPAVGKGKDKEQRPRKKPGRVPTSCAECRRLKLRCDRNIPCEKCVQRGCGSICPDGVLTPGKNGRLILAGTEELHDRISHFTSRIRELEGALRELQTQISDAPHPLLLKDSLEELLPDPAASNSTISSSATSAAAPAQERGEPSPPTVTSMEPDPAVITDFSGTLSVSGNGQSSFFGPTARLEFLARRPMRLDAKPSRLSHELFEFACEDHRGKTERFSKEIFQLRPPPSEASRLCELYLKSGKVMYSPVPRPELFDEIFMPVYRAESFSDLQPEALALLFVVFAIAVHFDPKRRTDNHDANEYYYVAKASLHLSGHRANTLHHIQTLIHMAQYLHFSGVESSQVESRSDYLCRAIRLGFNMGLHLHGIRWDLPEQLAQRRSKLFCEIFLLDTWTSFYSGRPPMVSLAFVDRTTPKDFDEGVDSEGNKKPGFHAWTYKYAILLHSIMAVAFGPRPPSYPTILDLDLKIRNFPVPSHWRPICDETPSPPPEVQMVRFLVSFAKESTLLNLHRRYFISALEESPNDLSGHSFIPSVLAIYRSAWRLMRGLRCIWNDVPELVSKLNVAWSQALSAAVIMCLFVTRTPGSHLTDPALNELDLLIELFEEAAPTCRVASELLINLQSIRRHSCTAAGRPHRNEGYNISTSDLNQLNGKTYLILGDPVSATSMQAPYGPPASHRSPPSQHHPQSTSMSHYSPIVKRDPSPSRATSTTLSEFPPNSPFGSTATLPFSSLHPHSLQSSSDSDYPHHSHAHVHHPRSHPSPTHSHAPTPKSRTSESGVSHVPRPSASSSPSSSHFFQQPSTPHPISTSLHPTILQDIHDFAMRGTPATSSVAHYFDFPPQEEVDDASISIQLSAQPRDSSGIGADATRALLGTSDNAGTRGHSVPGYQSHQSHTPTPIHQHAHSHSPSALGHTHSESDFGFFQTLESSFHVEYTPRSPFAAATFGIPGMTGGVHAAYQELAEQLGFH